MLRESPSPTPSGTCSSAAAATPVRSATLSLTGESSRRPLCVPRHPCSSSCPRVRSLTASADGSGIGGVALVRAIVFHVCSHAALFLQHRPRHRERHRRPLRRVRQAHSLARQRRGQDVLRDRRAPVPLPRPEHRRRAQRGFVRCRLRPVLCVLAILPPRHVTRADALSSLVT